MRFGKGELVNKARCCALLGWTRQQFDQYAREGMPTVEQPSDKGGEYKVHMGEVARWLVHRATERAGGSVALNLNDERARLAKLQADHQEMRNKQLAGELLPAAEVQALAEAEYIALRDRFRMIPQTVAERVIDAALKGAKGPEIARMLLAEIDATLVEMADAEVFQPNLPGSVRSRAATSG
jgi:phage terminase Nu1 subunit (DNA packaging protein)